MLMTHVRPDRLVGKKVYDKKVALSGK